MVDCYLHRQWSLLNTKLEGNQNRYSLTFLHIHWPSWGCWLKVSGTEILMSIAPSSCLLLTANWQHGIKLKRGGQLFFSPWLTHRLKIFLKGIPGSVCSRYKAAPSHVRGRRGLQSLIGQRLQSLLNPHRASPWPVMALTPTSTRPSPLTHKHIYTNLSKHACTNWTMPALINTTSLDMY